MPSWLDELSLFIYILQLQPIIALPDNGDCLCNQTIWQPQSSFVSMHHKWTLMYSQCLSMTMTINYFRMQARIDPVGLGIHLTQVRPIKIFTKVNVQVHPHKNLLDQLAHCYEFLWNLKSWVRSGKYITLHSSDWSPGKIMCMISLASGSFLTSYLLRTSFPLW